MRGKLGDFYFTLDLRSLALFRILIACVLIYDWFARWPNLEAFYTSTGIFPPNSPLPRAGGPYHFSLLEGFTSLTMVRLVFLIGLLWYVMLLIGLRTRVFAVLSFLFILSVVNRNTLIRHGGDAVLATMLMWGIFLPLGERFSLDALASRRRGLSPTTRSPRSLAAFAIVAQLAIGYLLTAMVKSGPAWRDGTALYEVMALDQFAKPLGQWLAWQPEWVIKAGTCSALTIEYAAAPLILLPFGQPWLRRIAIVMLVLLQGGIWATLALGSFPLVMTASLALLLGPADWAALRRWSSRLPWFGKFASRASAPGDLIEAGPDDAKNSRWQRVWPRVTRVLAETAVALMLITQLITSYNYNLAAAGCPRIWQPVLIDAIDGALQPANDWFLFAPNPMKDDGWWVIDGVTRSGASLDPLTGRPTSWAKPEDLYRRYDPHWRKHLHKLWRSNDRVELLEFGRYVTRTNHLAHPTDADHQLERFKLYYMLERTPPFAQRHRRGKTPPVERRLLWHHECFASSRHREGEAPAEPRRVDGEPSNPE